VGALEAQIAISLKQSVTLSPQQLNDCAGSVWGNEGCNGGFHVTAFNYIYNQSICADSFYPYNGQDNTCSYSGPTSKTHGNLFTVTKMLQSTPGNDAALIELLDRYGPATIAFDASSSLFSSYKKGIFASPNSPAGIMCNSSNISNFHNE
jgi:cathepsin L